MARLNIYILRQIALATILVALTLTGAVWLTQSLRFIDWIVNRGLPWTTFGYISMLILPNFLVVILPIALFAAVLFTYNKMQTDSEIVVMRAVGVGPGRLMAPALMVAAGATLACYLLTLYLLPTSYRAFKDLQFEIRNSYSNVLLQEGVFTVIDKNLTLFIREQGSKGDLHGLMVQDERRPEKPATMVAERGLIANTADGPRLLMVNGNRQELDRKTGRVSFLFFDRYVVEIDKASAGDSNSRIRESTERYLDELLSPDDIDDPRLIKRMQAEGHERLVSPLYGFSFVMIALAALLAGDFTRRGQAIRIAAAVGGVVLVQVLGFGASNLAARFPIVIPLMYLNVLVPIALSITLLLRGRIAPAPRRALAA